METVNKLRRIIDRQGDPLLERAMSEFIKAGDLQRHLKKVVKVYKERRDYFCTLLEEQLSGLVTFSKPEGGMAVWIVFRQPQKLRLLPEKLAADGFLLDSDILFIREFAAVRIGFASLQEKQMDALVAALKRHLHRK
jgi:GntR family transcriptional regulator/MocR family aminotransferase